MEVNNSRQSNETSGHSKDSKDQTNLQVQVGAKVHPDLMQFGKRTISKRKVAFLAVLLINTLVTLG